jgi:hypothetical protein
MDLRKYKIIFLPFDEQFNFIQNLLTHVLSIDSSLLSKRGLKSILKKLVISERDSEKYCKLPTTNKNLDIMYSSYSSVLPFVSFFLMVSVVFLRHSL